MQVLLDMSSCLVIQRALELLGSRKSEETRVPVVLLERQEIQDLEDLMVHKENQEQQVPLVLLEQREAQDLMDLLVNLDKLAVMVNQDHQDS